MFLKFNIVFKIEWVFKRDKFQIEVLYLLIYERLNGTLKQQYLMLRKFIPVTFKQATKIFNFKKRNIYIGFRVIKTLGSKQIISFKIFFVT